MPEYSFSGSVKRKLNDLTDVHKQYCVKENNKLYYTHPTYEVHSLSEYVGIVSRVNAQKNREPLYDKTIIYRGHSNTNYLPIPSLSRLKNLRDDTENVLINDLITLRPDEFSGLSSFDILSKMQHYRLPTRLLDFTLNPLVALFFACEDQSKNDARVLFHSTFIKRDTDDYVKSICDFAVKQQLVDTNNPIETYFCGNKISLKKYLFNTYSRELIVVRPKNWTKRLKNQNGLMMLFPNNMYDRLMVALIKSREIGIDKAIKEYVRGRVDRNIFDKISQIEPLAFYKNHYFQNDTHLFSRELYIALRNAYKNIDADDDSYWEKHKDCFKGRFLTSERLLEIDPDLLNKEFFSVVIKGKNKKTLLKELSLVGIDVSFIYPELEYTAINIKNIYSQ